jgi:hypothetical protein
VFILFEAWTEFLNIIWLQMVKWTQSFRHAGWWDVTYFDLLQLCARGCAWMVDPVSSQICVSVYRALRTSSASQVLDTKQPVPPRITSQHRLQSVVPGPHGNSDFSVNNFECTHDNKLQSQSWLIGGLIFWGSYTQGRKFPGGMVKRLLDLIKGTNLFTQE